MLLEAPSVIRPAFLWVPPSAVGTLGDEAAELAVQLDQEVREEERIALRALMPVKADGTTPAGLEAGIIAGRQQIKSWALEVALIHDGWVTKVGRCMWSAHQTKTSDDSFAHLTSLVESFDWLRKRVRRTYSGNGNHKIVFNDKLRTYPTLGAAGRQLVDRTIEFGARETGKTGRGRTRINRLTFDEWLLGTEAMKGAQVPMMGSAGDRFIRYGSSPGLLISESLRRLRDRGRIGTLDPALGDPSLSWVEWGSERVRLVRDPRTGRPRMERVLPTCEDPECTHEAGHVSGCYLDDPEVVRNSNPAYGTLRLPEDFVADERRTLSVVEYARERAGRWEDPPTEGTDDALAEWPDRAASTAAPSAPLLWGIDVAPNMAAAAIGVCGSAPAGECVEVVDHRRGSAWVPGRVAELVAKHGPMTVGVVKGSPAEALIPDLEPLDGVTVKPLPAADTTAACATFARAVTDGTVAHRDDPRLNDAVAGARRKFAGDGWRWTRVGSDSDICALYAVSVARHLWATEPVVDRSEDALLGSFG